LNEKISYIAICILKLDKNKDSIIYLSVVRRVKAWGKLINYYLKKRKYKSLTSNSSRQQQEKYSMRVGFLKRRMWQVLYLEIKNKVSFFLKQDLAYMTAAAFAAIWTLFANIIIWYNLQFENYTSLLNASGSFLGLSGTFILLCFVLVYILKDRIKELGRDKFQGGLFRHLPDCKEKIWYRNYQGNVESVGVIHETQEYLSKIADIPQEIINFRSYRQKGHYLEHENVIRYHKKIILEGKKIVKLGYDINAVKDIVRFNVKRFINLLDDPEYTRSFFKNNGESYSVKLPKVYYLDMVFSYSQQSIAGKMRSVALDSTRLILDKSGIVRVLRS